MRIDPIAYAIENLSPEKSPRYIIEIDFTDEVLRLTGNSDTDVPVDGNDVEHGTFVVLSSTSQSLDPGQAKSTIGAISFEAVDLSEAVTAKVRDKLSGVSPEIYTTANALGATYNADSTTGISKSDADTFRSQQAEVPTGYLNAIEVSSNVTPTSGARLYFDLDNLFNLVDGKQYVLGYWARHVGTGLTWSVKAAQNTGLWQNQTTFKNITISDTTWAYYEHSFTHSATTRYFGVREQNGSNNGGVFITGLSIKALQNDSIGLRGKTVTFLHGYESLSYADYQPVVTQQIRRVELQNTKYIFHCEDIQREAKKQIFDEVKTTLAADLTSTATQMEVYDTDAFTMVAHGTSYSDAPSATVGYLEIQQGNKREVIRYTGTTASTTFTGLTRGVLGTQAQEFTYESGSSENGIVVRQYVYLEMPVLKMIYAILTGDLLSQGGATLPAEWHLGIDSAWVDQAQFESHFDLYDSADDTAGFIARIEGVERTDGKSFIEKELLLLAGAFMPVQSDGTLGVKRMADIQPDAGYVGVLDRSNIISYSNLSHDMDDVFNRLEIQWNWNTTYKEFSRINILEDTDSQSTHGETETKILKLRGLYGSVHSESILDTMFNTLRDRYAGPPLRLSVTCKGTTNQFECGDVVRVRLPLQDFSSSGTLDRSFEIQKRSINWLTGQVTFDLFASSQRASLRTPSSSSQLADGFYTSGLTAGNEISPANFPGNVASSGGLTSIVGDITLTGHADMNNAAAIYWCAEDVLLSSGVTVTVTDNVQIRVKGFATIDGTIDGIEGSTNTSIQGYCGALVEAQWGLNIDTGVPGQDYYKAVSTGMATPLRRAPKYSLIPYLDIVTDANGIASGIPSDCRGISGAQGGRVYHVDLLSTLATGGAGGTGGAGLALVTRGGVFGASGKIDLSGGPGIKGGTHTSSGKVMHAGCGSPGGPGACYWIIDGKSATRPLLTTKFVGKMGAVDLDGSTPALTPSPVPHPQPGDASQETSANPGLYPARIDGNPQDSTQVDISQSCQRVQVLTGYVAPAADVDTSDDFAAAALAIRNFNNRNDRISDAIDAPLIANDETAVDHVINTDGSASVSLEWSWAGDESEIDGFMVYLRRSSSGTSYTFGTSVDEETTYTVKAALRHHLFHGLASDAYLTFGVQAYRVVDADVNSNQIIYSNITQPSHANEDPYQPNSNVAFAGDLTGTIQGAAAGALANQDTADFGTDVVGATKPADNATNNGATIDGSGDIVGGIQMTGSGTITLASAGHIKGGQTAYDTGTGFFLGYSGAAYKFSIGNSWNNKLTWSGSTLTVAGDINIQNAATVRTDLNVENGSTAGAGGLGEVTARNTNFEAGDLYWAHTTGFSIASGNAHQGSNSLQCTGVVTATSRSEVYFPTASGERFLFGGYIKTSAGAAFTSAGIRVTWYDSAKTELSSATASISSANTSYALLIDAGVAPANAEFARLEALVVSPSSGTVYFDDLFMAPMLADALIDALQTANAPAEADADVTIPDSGTWTPQLWDNSLSGSEGQTYNDQEGFYRQIASDLMFAQFFIGMSSLGTLTTSQQVRIGGLPATGGATITPGDCIIGLGGGLSGSRSGYALNGFVNTSSDYIVIGEWTSSQLGTGALTIAELTASGQISGTVIYRI